jgi:hypothetical protein
VVGSAVLGIIVGVMVGVMVGIAVLGIIVGVMVGIIVGVIVGIMVGDASVSLLPLKSRRFLLKRKSSLPFLRLGVSVIAITLITISRRATNPR